MSTSNEHNYKQTTDYKLQDCYIASNYKLQTTNYRLQTTDYKLQTTKVVTLHRKHFESFIWEVLRFSDDSCSKFQEDNWSLYNIYSLISP